MQRARGERGQVLLVATLAQLDTIFAAIASDISSGSSRLVDDGF
jgi:hypothetical protein